MMEESFIKEGALTLIKNAKEFNAEAFAKAALEAKDESGGIKPRAIWKAAENNPSHPAYKHIEWDDAKAAGMHRDDQVRAMLRLVSTLLPGRDEPIPRFHSLPAETGGHRYFEAAKIISSEYMTKKLLEQAERDFQAWRNRYGMLVNIAEYAQGIESALRKAQGQSASSTKRTHREKEALGAI